MPVEKDINLDKPLTTEDINNLEEEANRLEKIAKEAKEDAKKAKEFQKEEDKMLNDAVKKIEQLEKEAIKAENAKNKIGRSIKEVNQLATHRGGLAGMGGADPFAETEEFGMGGMIPGAGQIPKRSGFGTGGRNDPMGNMATMQERFNLMVKELEKKTKEAQKKASKERAENSRRLASQKKAMSKIQKAQADFFAVQRNPMGFGMGQMKGLLMKGGIYGFIALAVLAMAEQVYSEIKRLYAEGGPYDVRKQMLARDREITELDNILARRRGSVFFTSDTELQQGAPSYSNTTRLRDRAIIYQNLHLGE